MFMFRTVVLTITFYLASSSFVEASVFKTCKICHTPISECLSYRLKTNLDLEMSVNNMILLSILNDPEMKRISKEDAEEITHCYRFQQEYSLDCRNKDLNFWKGQYKKKGLIFNEVETPAAVLILKDAATIIKEKQRPYQGYPHTDWNIKAIIKFFIAPKTLLPSEKIWLLSRLDVHPNPSGMSVEESMGGQKQSRIKTSETLREAETERIYNDKLSSTCFRQDYQKLEAYRESLAPLKQIVDSIFDSMNKKAPPYESIASDKSSELSLAFPRGVMHIVCAFLASQDLISLASANKRMQEFAIGPISQRLHQIRNDILQLDYHAKVTFMYHGPRKNEKCPSALELLITRAKALDAVDFLHAAATVALNQPNNSLKESQPREEFTSTPGTMRVNHSPKSPPDEEQ